MRTGESGELFRELLVPFAASVGLDFNVEIMRPGNTPVQVAFTFVICGAQLLVCYTEPDAVPIISKKTSKRVAKAMRRSFGTPEARDAAVFLAQAFAVDRFEKSRRHGEEADADPSFRQLIQDHFPLSDELAAQLDAITAEYGTIGTRQVGDEVRPRTESTGGYSRSHKASERNSDEDEDRGDTEPRYLGTFLRAHAALTAIEIAIGPTSGAGVRDNLTAPLEHGLKGLTFWLEHDSGWASYSDGEWWDHAASRAIGARLPDDDDIVPVDTVVARLREQIVQRLEVDEQLGLPEPSLQALDYFANDVADNDVDHAILTDALLMGYTLRIAERELLSATGFDDRTIARLRDAAADDLVAVIASLVSHAQHVADDLPTPFRQGASAWSTLSTWAGQRALDRDQARRNSGMETGGPPTISPDECERAFGLGYGIRYADEALDATLSSEAADTELSDFDPLDPTDVNVHDAAIDLLTRTEAIFVDLGAPAPLGLLITRALLMGRYHADESHPMYGALLAVTVFGYAMRMAQAEQAPLPEEEADSFDLWIERTDHGDADHQAMSDDPESLQELAIDAGELADDQLRLLTLLRVAVQVWEEFQRLATDQLHRNLRTNGLKRRLLPTAAVIENLICLGCAARVVDEVAGESPPSKSDLGLI